MGEWLRRESLWKIPAPLSFFLLLSHGNALRSEILAGNYQRPFFRFPDVFPSGALVSTFSRCPLSLGDNHINWSLIPGGCDLESVCLWETRSLSWWRCQETWEAPGCVECFLVTSCRGGDHIGQWVIRIGSCGCNLIGPLNWLRPESSKAFAFSSSYCFFFFSSFLQLDPEVVFKIVEHPKLDSIPGTVSFKCQLYTIWN